MCGGQGRKNWPLKRSKLWTHNIKPGDCMPYEVCEKCYGTKNKGHECGPAVLPKDDLCSKCLIILSDADKSVGHYAKDMLEIDRIVRAVDMVPTHTKLAQVSDILEKREKRILKEMENGRIERG